jgi:simple sugar transport system permease protein
MMVATLGGFAGILEAFRINTIDPNLGGGFGIMFTAVSAAVIGGTALAGGSGTSSGRPWARWSWPSCRTA